MLMLYFGLVIVIYVYFQNSSKQLNEFLKIKIKKFQMWNKEFGIDNKKEFSMIFEGLCITPKNHERNYILNDYLQNIYFGFDEI
jgi:hypothetical protein